MERIKFDKDKPDKAFDFISQNALGNVIIMEKEPEKDEVKANTLAYYNNYLYIRLANGELKKVSVTDIP